MLNRMTISIEEACVQGLAQREKSGFVRIRRNSEMLVLIPPTKYSSSAQLRRAMTCSRFSPYPTSLARSGS